MQVLTITDVIKNSIEGAKKNLAAVFVNVILWILTIWIPYLNVGTTIGIFAGVILKMSRDEEVKMTEIFNPIYRKKMGDFFILWGLLGAGVMVGIAFMVIPGYVIGIAWSLSTLLLIDKDLTALQALKESNDMTYGNKWTIFLSMFVIMLGGSIILGIISAILMKLGTIGQLLTLIVYLGGMACLYAMIFSATAYIYKTLKE